MPAVLNYPGVYVEESTSNVRTITGVATSITAFVGRALRGRTDSPNTVLSFSDFVRTCGGLWVESTLGYAVQQFFVNGGGQALIVRVAAADATKAELQLAQGFTLVAAGEGQWGNKLVSRVDFETSNPQDAKLFNLSVKDTGTNALEVFRNVSIDVNSARFVTHVLEQQSQLVRVSTPAGQLARPGQSAAPAKGVDPFDPKGNGGASLVTTPGTDGGPISDVDVATGPNLQADKKGIFMLEKADLFNILCLPPPTRDSDWSPTTWGNAAQYVQTRRAFLVVDAPAAWTDPTQIDLARVSNDIPLAAFKDHAALYFPRVLQSDPLKEGRLDSFAPCGVVAGIYARTDAQRGVWKAPAGIDASLGGVVGLSLNGQPTQLTDGENGLLNPIAVNCLRTFPASGNVVWGARTVAGSDALASQWKYVPVRRFALFLEESLYRGTQWVVFEPNDEPLWAQIRLNIGAFMHNLFRQGAFEGTTPRDAYFVKCDKETTTQNDIDLGIVNIIVGFAPLKPAEFVVIQIQQIAGQLAV